MYRQQLSELLTGYGPIMELWLDGSSVVPTGDLVRRSAPAAMVFQGPQATIRWVGNEDGFAPYPAWNALAAGNPFVRHEFLSALLETGCVAARSGWQPQFLLLERDRRPDRLMSLGGFKARGDRAAGYSEALAAVEFSLEDYLRACSDNPDFFAGAAERLVDEGGTRGDLLFVEGQGSLFHPAYSAVTLGLLHGCSPDVLVLAHRADATHFEGYRDVALPPLPELIEAYEMICRPRRPARVAAIALNPSRLSGGEAREAIARTEDLTGLTADDLVRFGSDRVLEAVLKHL